MSSGQAARPPTEGDPATSENRSVHEIRSGSVKAAIWANETRNGIMHTTTFDRR